MAARSDDGMQSLMKAMVKFLGSSLSNDTLELVEETIPPVSSQRNYQDVSTGGSARSAVSVGEDLMSSTRGLLPPAALVSGGCSWEALTFCAHTRFPGHEAEGAGPGCDRPAEEWPPVLQPSVRDPPPSR